MSERAFLDTHVVMWLAAGQLKKLSRNAVQHIESKALLYSPMTKLEMDYLHECGRLKYTAETMLERLHNQLIISQSLTLFRDVCASACHIGWPRETFDRLIVADAAFHHAPLITADEKILQHYPLAVW